MEQRRKLHEWKVMLAAAKEAGIGIVEFSKRTGIPVSTIEKAQKKLEIYLGQGRLPAPVNNGDGSCTILANKKGEWYEVLVDEADAEWLGQWVWHVDNNGYAYRCEGTAQKNLKYIIMHRFILNAPSGMVVDHVNRARLDNRRSNLRLATAADNVKNASKRKDNTTGFKGVSKKGDGYIAQIQVNKKGRFLGKFATPEEAAEAYRKACTELHGDFACPHG